MHKIVHDKHNNELHWTRVKQNIMHGCAQLCTIMQISQIVNYAQLCTIMHVHNPPPCLWQGTLECSAVGGFPRVGHSYGGGVNRGGGGKGREGMGSHPLECNELPALLADRLPHIALQTTSDVN